jgi:hypothetical protein
MVKKAAFKKGGKKDHSQIALSVVEQAIGGKLVPGAEQPTAEQSERPVDEGKNPAAVALGRLGGLKGGKARSEKLTPEERREIAKKASKARWDQYRKG